MPEYDAFGREIGEDPLAGLREAVPQRVEATAPPPRIEVARPRRRRRGGVAGLLVVVAIVGAAALFAGGVVDESSDVINSITPQEAPPPPAGLQRDSLIRRANFAAALKTLHGAGVGRPMLLRVAPDRIDATVVNGGKLHQIQLTADGELRELGSGVPAGDRATVGYGAIDSAAPERLTRAGATRRHPARSIDYVLFTAGPTSTWGAYFKGGRIVIGDRRGRPQRVL